MHWMRRLYDWVLGWADSPYGTAALAVLSFAEASFFPVPPDVLLIALCVGRRRRALWFAAICSAASLLGGVAGYVIGWGVWALVSPFFFQYVPGFTEASFLHVQELYRQWDIWIVFTAAFTPIPYKLITVTAGVCEIHFGLFVVASLVGRSMRFFLVAGLLYLFGEAIRRFIDRWFNVLATLFTILLIGGFLLIARLSG